MTTRKAATANWWAGYGTCAALTILAGEAKVFLEGGHDCGDPTCRLPQYMTLIALLLLWHSIRKSRKAERIIEATTWEPVEPTNHKENHRT